MRGQENKRIDVQWDRLCGLSHFFVEAMWEEKKVAGRHKGPGAVRVNPFEAAKSHEVAVKPSSEGFANGASEQ